MDIPFETLVKLGEALYIHKKLIKNAEDAEKAVEYLASCEVLYNDNQTSL